MGLGPGAWLVDSSSHSKSEVGAGEVGLGLGLVGAGGPLPPPPVAGQLVLKRKQVISDPTWEIQPHVADTATMAKKKDKRLAVFIV